MLHFPCLWKCECSSGSEWLKFCRHAMSSRLCVDICILQHRDSKLQYTNSACVHQANFKQTLKKGIQEMTIHVRNTNQRKTAMLFIVIFFSSWLSCYLFVTYWFSTYFDSLCFYPTLYFILSLLLCHTSCG